MEIQPPSPRKGGRFARVRAAERRAIELAFLVEGPTRTALAATFHRTREAIDHALRGDDFERLRAAVEKDSAEDARAVLRRHQVVAANGWAQAIAPAVAKGDHRPCRDLLLHTRAIDPVQAGGQAQIAIIFQLGSSVPGLAPCVDAPESVVVEVAQPLKLPRLDPPVRATLRGIAAWSPSQRRTGTGVQ